MYETWKKKDETCNTIESVIEHHVGMPMNEFLNPKEDPYIPNLTLAKDVLIEEVAKGSPVTIVADYDCDGVCSATIMYLGLKAYGLNPVVRIPRRYSEGYGLSMKIIDEIQSGLVITVDNGIAAIEQVKAAKEKGLCVIVTDHHLPVVDETNGTIILPEADVIIDPNVNPEFSEFHGYCGAAIAYRFIKNLDIDVTTLEYCRAIAGIATVADVMELKGDNRRLVIDSLELVRNRKVPLGLNALLNELKINYVDEGDYGFKIGPVINAAGRLYDDGPAEVFRLLTTDASMNDSSYQNTLSWCEEQAKKLLKWNKERQELSRISIQRAEMIMEEQGMKGDIPLVIYDPDCSEGIIGIVAGHLAEKYRTPTLIFTNSKTEGILKGSGRNYGNVHLKHLLDTAKPLFVGYGGHAGAAGMSIQEENLKSLQKQLAKELDGKDFGVDPNTYFYDLEISLNEVPTMIQKVKKYAPYGEGNPPITFKVKNFELSPKAGKFFMNMGNQNQHLKLFGKNVSVVAFDMDKEYKELGQPKKLDILGALGQNFYNGIFYDQIEAFDIRPVAAERTDAYLSFEDLLTFK